LARPIAPSSPRHFKALREQFREHLAPVGPLEEMLAERIVTTYWRLRRAVTAESGEIALNVDGGHWWRNRPHRIMDKFVSAALSPLNDVAYEMEAFAGGLCYLKQVLRQVRAAVEKDGELTDAALQETHYAGKANSLTNRLAALRSVPVAGTHGLDEAAVKVKRRDQVLRAIDRMLEQYDWQKQRCSDREEAEESARQAAAVLPSADTLDKILRYETTLERQLYRAMNQLERLQRRRNGEFVPPPISMEMSH
jgi:hypothetical protein